MLAERQGHCIDKAIVLIAALRHLQIPSRLGLAKVINHIGSSKLEHVLKTNVLVPHGFVEVYLNENWVKCTPAFNSSLCQKLGLEPLEFDGELDSIFQPYDSAQNKSMEYLEYLGSFATLPEKQIQVWMQNEYPHMFNSRGQWLSEKLQDIKKG
ncbi:MAG: transglutaminase family protein [Flavobacteriales bacterium]